MREHEIGDAGQKRWRDLMAQRKDAWLCDELILALDLYVRARQQPSEEQVGELSRVRSIPIEPELAAENTFVWTF
jgi:hypothetical protein